MAYSLQSRTVQEAVAPYMGASVPGANTAAPVCRAIFVPADAGVTVVFADGSSATLVLTGGVIYPIAATQTNSATVIFLY